MVLFFFFKQKTAYEMRISDWSSDVCSSDLGVERLALARQVVLALLEVLGGGAVERQHAVVAQLVTGRLRCLGNEAERLVGRGKVGGEAALVAAVGVVTGLLQPLAQGVEAIPAHAPGLGPADGADRQPPQV